MNNPFKESNFKIQVWDNSFVVRSDSERFGINEIVFQGISYKECLDYITEREGSMACNYYVIKDLSSWRSDIWKETREKSPIERFNTVEDAIAKFLEYKAMDYLKEEVINPDNNKPMRRLTLGVSHSVRMMELDLLHTEGDKTLLLSDAVGERENGYEGFMTNSNFVADLEKIIGAVRIDEYSYYRGQTVEELINEHLNFWKEQYPEEIHTREEAEYKVEIFLRRRPDYLKNHKINDRIAFEDLQIPFLDIQKYQVIKSFREKTNELFHRIEGLNPGDIEEWTRVHINSIIEVYGIDAEIVDLAIVGSRARGLESENSDLDIVVELNTKEKEDYLFNILNQSNFNISGIKVDINPITKHQTGTLKEYLVKAESYLQNREKNKKRNEEQSVLNVETGKRRKHGR